jgi:hypothetical protein
VNDRASSYLIHYESKSGVEDHARAAFESVVRSGATTVTWIRKDEEGAACAQKAWLDGGSREASRVGDILQQIFGPVLPSPSPGAKQQPSECVWFGGATLPKALTKKQEFKTLCDLCPSYVEIKVGPFTTSKSFCTVNVKGGTSVTEPDFRDFMRREKMFPGNLKVVPSSLSPRFSLVFDCTLDSRDTGVVDDNTQANATAGSPGEAPSSKPPRKSKPKALIQDLPLPARILLNIQSKSKTGDRCVTVERSEDDPELLQMRMQPQTKTSWAFASSWGGGIEFDKAPQVGRESLMSVVLNHAPKADVSVFGVCASALFVGKSMQTVIVDHVTLLPPGKEWMTKAFLCLDGLGDKDLSRLAVDMSGLDDDLLQAHTDSGHMAAASSALQKCDNLKDADRDLSKIIHSLLTDVDTIRPGALREHIDRLFYDDIGPTPQPVKVPSNLLVKGLLKRGDKKSKKGPASLSSSASSNDEKKRVNLLHLLSKPTDPCVGAKEEGRGTATRTMRYSEKRTPKGAAARVQGEEMREAMASRLVDTARVHGLHHSKTKGVASQLLQLAKRNSEVEPAAPAPARRLMTPSMLKKASGRPLTASTHLVPPGMLTSPVRAPAPFPELDLATNVSRYAVYNFALGCF